MPTQLFVTGLIDCYIKAAGESFSCMVSDLLDDTEGTTGEEHEFLLKQAAFSAYNGVSARMAGRETHTKINNKNI